MKKTALCGLLGALTLVPAMTSAAGAPHAGHQTVVITEHSGDDDLLTAGLGKTGLASANAAAHRRSARTDPGRVAPSQHLDKLSSLWSTSPRPAATAACSAPTSMWTATTPAARG